MRTTCSECGRHEVNLVTVCNGTDHKQVCPECAGRILNTARGFKVYGTSTNFDESLLAKLRGPEKTEIVEAMLRGAA